MNIELENKTKLLESLIKEIEYIEKKLEVNEFSGGSITEKDILNLRSKLNNAWALYYLVSKG